MSHVTRVVPYFEIFGALTGNVNKGALTSLKTTSQIGASLSSPSPHTISPLRLPLGRSRLITRASGCFSNLYGLRLQQFRRTSHEICNLRTSKTNADNKYLHLGCPQHRRPALRKWRAGVKSWKNCWPVDTPTPELR